MELRSYRKAVVYPEPAEPRRPRPTRKDTKTWCRGKVGVEHTPRWEVDPGRRYSTRQPDWWIYVCTRCRKHFDWCIGSGNPCRCGHHSRGPRR